MSYRYIPLKKLAESEDLPKYLRDALKSVEAGGVKALLRRRVVEGEVFIEIVI